ncbi:TPA: preprotein translocase subunit Sec61beta [Candidatus Woesearchaeota archaeon]|nr:preprotein translocase subunit Sec61beta [Candidatus Woesearchaeota archaeon]
MPRDNNIRMPSSSAGVMSFYDEERSKIRIKPAHVVILCVLVSLVVILLEYTTIFR